MTYVYDMPSVILALIGRSFPERGDSVSLVLTLPAVVAMVTSFLIAPLLMKFSKKVLALASIALGFLSGMLVILFGAHSFGMLLVASVMIGITAGSIPSITNTLLTMHTTQENRARIIGYNVSFGAVGNTIFMLLAGALSRDGNWIHSYYTYFLIIPLFLFVLWKLPMDRPSTVQTTTQDENRSEQPAENSTVPPYIYIMFVSFVLLTCSFYIWTLRYSSYVITEFKLGTSMEAGLVSSTYTCICIITGFLVQPWFRVFRKFSVPVAMLICGAGMLIPVFTTGSIAGLFVSGILYGLGATISIASTYSMIGLIIPKQKTGFFMSLFNGGYNLGKFCSQYLAMLAVLIFGNFLGNFRMAAIGCIVAACIGTPAYFAAYRQINSVSSQPSVGKEF